MRLGPDAAQYVDKIIFVAQFGGLTDREWEAAIRMVSKYRRQIGPRPEVE
jgi:hypothetical protein